MRPRHDRPTAPRCHPEAGSAWGAVADCSRRRRQLPPGRRPHAPDAGGARRLCGLRGAAPAERRRARFGGQPGEDRAASGCALRPGAVLPGADGARGVQRHAGPPGHHCAGGGGALSADGVRGHRQGQGHARRPCRRRPQVSAEPVARQQTARSGRTPPVTAAGRPSGPHRQHAAHGAPRRCTPPQPEHHHRGARRHTGSGRAGSDRPASAQTRDELGLEDGGPGGGRRERGEGGRQ
mmetsp:Transcript_18499/g.37583  ORF Transcript_18499/g.37583 Transcript_18499/m.37583 type:complete len:237 (+) Transcript_18499:83-793(+)